MPWGVAAKSPSILTDQKVKAGKTLSEVKKKKKTERSNNVEQARAKVELGVFTWKTPTVASIIPV